MEPWHKAWLERHTDKTEQWLSERLKDGFDVHHVDGDKSNNDPMNLILVEHLDHLRVIHGVGGNRMLLAPRQPSQKTIACYELRATGIRWAEVGERLGMRASRALNDAKIYAMQHGLQWPIPHRQGCRCTYCLRRNDEAQTRKDQRPQEGREEAQEGLDENSQRP